MNPDIAMCNRGDCPKRIKCYRFMAVPDPLRQSYIVIEDIDNCEHYWEVTKSMKRRLDIQKEHR